MCVACNYETAELFSGDPRRQYRILADLGNGCSGRGARMGGCRGGLSLAESHVDHRNLGVGDPVAWAGKLCLASGVDDSTQGPIRVPPRSRDGYHPLRGCTGSVLFRILDFIFLWPVQTSLANRSTVV